MIHSGHLHLSSIAFSLSFAQPVSLPRIVKDLAVEWCGVPIAVVATHYDIFEREIDLFDSSTHPSILSLFHLFRQQQSLLSDALRVACAQHHLSLFYLSTDPQHPLSSKVCSLFPPTFPSSLILLPSFILFALFLLQGHFFPQTYLSFYTCPKTTTKHTLNGAALHPCRVGCACRCCFIRPPCTLLLSLLIRPSETFWCGQRGWRSNVEGERNAEESIQKDRREEKRDGLGIFFSSFIFSPLSFFFLSSLSLF